MLLHVYIKHFVLQSIETLLSVLLFNMECLENWMESVVIFVMNNKNRIYTHPRVNRRHGDRCI